MWGRSLKSASSEGQSPEARFKKGKSPVPRVRVFKSESLMSSPQSPLSRIVTYVSL